MSFNKGHCSPISLRKKRSESNGGSHMNSCLNRKLLEKLANILNNNPNCDHIDCKMNDEIKLHDMISNNMSKISGCNTEYCWLTVQDIVHKLKGPEIDEFKNGDI